MISDFSNLFSSRAKFKVLRLLLQYSQPIPLRTIADLIELPIRSVVLALEDFLKQKLVFDSRKANSRLFQIDRNHPLYGELKDIFAQIEASEIRLQLPRNQREATKAFKFAQSANRFFAVDQ